MIDFVSFLYKFLQFVLTFFNFCVIYIVSTIERYTLMKLSNKDNFTRVISFYYNPNTTNNIVLGCLCYASSKLWNVANYEIKNWNKESGKPYPDWYYQKRNLKDHFWFKNLPSQTAQEVLKQLHESWKSFYKLKKTGGIENLRPPRYKNMPFNIRFLNNGFKIKDDTIILSIPKNQKTYLKSTYNIDIQYLQIKIPEVYTNSE